jgi:hypothetical protein
MMNKIKNVEYKLAKSRLNSVRAKQGIGATIGVGILAGIGYYAWTKYRQLPLIPNQTMVYLSEAARYALGTESILSEGTEMSEDALLAVIAKDWEVAFVEIKDLGSALFDARISNQRALISISQAKISSATDKVAYYKEVQRANTAGADLVTILTFFIASPWTFSGKVYDQQMVDGAQATLNKVNSSETAKIKVYNLNISNLEREKSSWNNKTGTMYNEYLTDFSKSYVIGSSIDALVSKLRSKLNIAINKVRG